MSMDPRVIYAPKNPIATYTDQYGDERIIHAPQGANSALRRARTTDTPTLRMNRAVGILLGRNIRARRLELGISQRQLCERAGMVDVNPKQRINGIESARRAEGVRLGTLYGLASALECSVVDLLPSSAEVMRMAGVGERTIIALSVSQ